MCTRDRSRDASRDRAIARSLDGGSVEIDLWHAELDLDPATREAYWATLSAEEHHRAQRFRFDRDRERFIAARGITRVILARYVHSAPDALVFELDACGKPLVAGPDAGTLVFNTSRTGALMVCAVASSARLGVDVESLDAFPASRQEIIGRFAASERAAIGRLPEIERAAAIAACWTRKEAFVKARGEGLSWPLDAFEVTVPPDPPRVVRTSPDADEAGRWSLIAIEVPNAVGTIAIDRAGCRVTLREWPDRRG